MAVQDYTIRGFEEPDHGGSRLYDLWQTVYSEYDSPQWFQDEIWGPMSNYFTGADVKMDFRDPDRLMESEWGDWFSPFDTRDWEALDEMFTTQSTHLDKQTEFLSETHDKREELDEKVFGEKRDARIERAELRHKQTMRSEDMRKDDIRLKAIQSLTNLDSIIGHSGISSAGLNKKKEIQLESVKSQLNQANMSRKLSSEGLGKEKTRAINDYERSLDTENLKRDVQYDSKFLDVNQKKEAAHMDLITNKLSVYDEWRAGQVGTVNKIFSQEAHLYDPESLQEAWSKGGEEYELMKGMYDDFSGNFDQWKDENPELWAKMKANPDEYIATDVRKFQEGEQGFTADYDAGYGLGGFLAGGPFGMLAGGLAGGSEYGYTTPKGWSYADLSEEQIETALMNHVFTTGAGEWQGTKFKEEWGEWTPWMVMKDVATHTGEFAVTGAGLWSDVDAEGDPQFLNPYYYGDFMTDPYTEARETGDYNYFEDTTPADQYTDEDEKWYDYFNPYINLWKDYFYS